MDPGRAAAQLCVLGQVGHTWVLQSQPALAAVLDLQAHGGTPPAPRKLKQSSAGAGGISDFINLNIPLSVHGSCHQTQTSCLHFSGSQSVLLQHGWCEHGAEALGFRGQESMVCV